MKIGELVIVQNGKHLTIGQCMERPNNASLSRVRVSFGRNKEKKVQAGKIIFATGLTVSNQSEINSFVKTCEALTSSIDLAEVWETAHADNRSFKFQDIADLYWGSNASPHQKASLLLHLNRESMYFTNAEGLFLPKSSVQVEELKTRRKRESQNRQDADKLFDALAEGMIPKPLSVYQANLIQHLRGYLISGESYIRAGVGKEILRKIGIGLNMSQDGLELLIKAGVLLPDEPIEFEKSALQLEFSEPVTTEANSVDLNTLLSNKDRKDLTPLLVFTIDDKYTEDRDDALSITVIDDNSYQIGIHIADAGSLIAAESAMDKEASRRMATVYTPERKIPMLHPYVSSRKGSIVPGCRRAAISLLVNISTSSDITKWEIVPSVIQSKLALTYEETDKAIKTGDDHLANNLKQLHLIAGQLRQKRLASGALSIESPEMHIRLPNPGTVEVDVVTRATPARLTVTEFMILCNSLMATYFKERDLPAIYRSQTPPDLRDLPNLSEGPLQRFHLFKRLTPSSSSLIPTPHGGLGAEQYIQVTSPLRRYTDLIMQRQINHFIYTGTSFYARNEIDSLAQRSDFQIREIAKIEESRRRYWFLKYLQQRLYSADSETIFLAVVLENEERRPSLMELVEFPFRFRVRIPWSTLPGETVSIRLMDVDLWKRFPKFVCL